jgi:hypothetical protein
MAAVKRASAPTDYYTQTGTATRAGQGRLWIFTGLGALPWRAGIQFRLFITIVTACSARTGWGGTKRSNGGCSASVR